MRDSSPMPRLSSFARSWSDGSSWRTRLARTFFMGPPGAVILPRFSRVLVHFPVRSRVPGRSPQMRRPLVALILAFGFAVSALEGLGASGTDFNAVPPCRVLDTRLPAGPLGGCLLYTSDAADEEDSVDLGGRRILK